jgi:hypothetical protein
MTGGPSSQLLNMDEQNDCQTVRISSHNLNGFDRSKPFLKNLCDSHPDSIRALQEHWLRPTYKKQAGVNKLRTVHSDFDGFGTSAMKQQMESGITKGRPFGGTGYIYNKRFSDCLKPILGYKHDRVTVLELSHTEGKILLINIYFPYYDANNVSDQVTMYV